MINLQCKICGKSYQEKPYRAEVSLYCSRTCYGISNKGVIPKSAFKKGQRPSPKTEFKKGKNHIYFGKSSPALGKKWKLTIKTKENMSMAQKGRRHPKTTDEKHPFWKGNKVGYRGLHTWKDRKSGKPKKCEHCGIENKKRYHWANKSRLYKRDINDWIRLCPKCHKKYDSQK